MSFFEDASLVLIPSAQKLSKIYSVKPTDGTGDLTFTRSNDTASRVASIGLIEKVRTNLAAYSQDFSNAAWTKGNVSTKPTNGLDNATASFGATDWQHDLCYCFNSNTGSGRFTFHFTQKAIPMTHCCNRVRVQLRCNF
jgi:hypothetical protein